jgi:hypothetical protein
MPLRQNTVCVIPPARGLTISSGRFIVNEHAQQLRFPIDHFFRLLAAEAGKRTIAVILSGTGSDGTEGAKEVKDAGGVVLVQLQATCKQLETCNEGFMSANEVLMSTNEELQSTNEELKTSKEEPQALNEELLTVNAELSEKVDELNQATSDLENLLSSSEIATIYLDLNLNVKRFTPAIAGLFDMISADIGRPLQPLSGKIDLPSFSEDAAAILAGRTVVDLEVTTQDGSKCYLKRVPERSGDNRRHCHHLCRYHRAEAGRGGETASFQGAASQQRKIDAPQLHHGRTRAPHDRIEKGSQRAPWPDRPGATLSARFRE